MYRITHVYALYLDFRVRFPLHYIVMSFKNTQHTLTEVLGLSTFRKASSENLSFQIPALTAIKACRYMHNKLY